MSPSTSQVLWRVTHFEQMAAVSLQRTTSCLARDLALLANDDLRGLHIPLDLPIDLQNAPADDAQPLPDNPQIVADDRLVPAFRGSRTPLRTVDHRWGGRAGAGRAWLGK